MPADLNYESLRAMLTLVEKRMKTLERNEGIQFRTGVQNPMNPLGADLFGGSTLREAEAQRAGYDSGTGLLTVPFISDFSIVPLDFGTAQGGSTTTITLRAGASAVDDFYVGELAYITAGPGAGQAGRVITDYVGATKVATIAPDWTTNPTGASSYSLGGTELVVA